MRRRFVDRIIKHKYFSWYLFMSTICYYYYYYKSIILYRGLYLLYLYSRWGCAYITDAIQLISFTVYFFCCMHRHVVTLSVKFSLLLVIHYIYAMRIQLIIQSYHKLKRSLLVIISKWIAETKSYGYWIGGQLILRIIN